MDDASVDFIAQLDCLTQRSDFVDCPSGEIDVLVKKVSTHYEGVHAASNYVRIELISAVKRDRILVDVGASRKDLSYSMPLSDYNLKPSSQVHVKGMDGPRDTNVNIIMNHVANMVSRHYADAVRVSIVSMSGVDGFDPASPGSAED